MTFSLLPRRYQKRKTGSEKSRLQPKSVKADSRLKDARQILSAKKLRAIASGSSIALVLFSLARCTGEGDGDQNQGEGLELPEAPDSTELSLGNSNEDASQTPPTNPLCGTGICFPDFPDYCDAAQGDGLGGFGGMGPGLPQGGLGGLGGLDGAAVACHVRPPNTCASDECTTIRACSRAGEQLEGEPCQSNTDCAPSMACVERQGKGFCAAYCCAGETSCSEGQYCGEAKSKQYSETILPVCLAVDACDFAAEANCHATGSCECGQGYSCTPQKDTNANVCVLSGTLAPGEPCTGQSPSECQGGAVCSLEEGCLKLCEISAAEKLSSESSASCPEGFRCAKPPEFPDNLGVCTTSSIPDEPAAP
ncbi:MAG: hypothetical protein MK135_05120 [Polyangiaceae bacterium]|nr:hypothetical protein [Polyangiaceae bacterium]